MHSLYLEQNQARQHEPTVYENLLGDSIERAFSADIVDLEGLANWLNQQGPDPQHGTTWTVDTLAAELKRLGDA